jgi:hypothetical protein
MKQKITTLDKLVALPGRKKFYLLKSVIDLMPELAEINKEGFFIKDDDEITKDEELIEKMVEANGCVDNRFLNPLHLYHQHSSEGTTIIITRPNKVNEKE